MAKARRTTKASATNIDDSTAFDEFDAQASLLALQKHVDAAANGAVNTNGASVAAAPQHPSSAFSPDALASTGIAYAASAALLAASLAHSPVDSASSHPEAEIHPDLRSAPTPPDHSQFPSQYPPLAPATMSSTAPVASVAPAAPVAAPVSQPAPSALPPQAASPNGTQEPAPEVITDGRRGPRRELSTSKRAAQNRAAQRAFRQRKEGYIKKLEKQVQDFSEMETQFKITQSENYALREYIIHLQSRLLDAKAELPQPPANLNLAGPGMPPIMGMGPPPQSPSLVQQQQRQEQQLQLQQQQALEQQEHEQQLQHFRDLERQKESVSPVTQEATASTSVEPSAPTDSATTPSDNAKNESTLARVAQAVAELGNSTISVSDSKESSNGSAIKPNPDEHSAGEPMDTTDEAITQNLQKLSEPVASM
ncbi:hypothetical protein SEUCBS139899_007513 [Sporothrix eucalyptigena]